ncbi:MAG: NADPH:quinone reductase [Actinomycetales bacterium]|nr:MAG: NADPH:quinone reductase [Actinomycetales bacterium]
MRRVLVINGHPDRESFCHSLAEKYKAGADQSGPDCTIVNLADLEFSPILQHGYRKRTELEPDLKKVWELIKEANHLVFVYPNWWGTYPALLKGFIDRLFLPGLAFEFQANRPLPRRLLRGRSARLIVTSDNPNWYYALRHRRPGHNSMKRSILGICGVKPVRITTLVGVTKSTDAQRKAWHEQVEELGKRLV